MTATDVREIFRRPGRFTEQELDEIRRQCAQVDYFAPSAHVVNVRMDVELMDAIRRLDETSTKLIKTTNLLTAVILGVTVIGVLTAILQYCKI